ncbi:uncharacterized protein [Branchiostoma lanceolatum]|uniref:uncharacterized protein n=1 Tax=Branchiostoma lanceolatum TaxID=7740 RepID=UPI003452357F
MPRHPIRKELTYSYDNVKRLLEHFGLDYQQSPDGRYSFPLDQLIDCLTEEACVKCDTGEHGAALSGFEAALGIVNHFPNKPRSAVGIYWLRAQYCFDMENFLKAIQDCTQVINSDKDGTGSFTSKSYEMKINAHLRLGQADQALKTAEEYVIHYPWITEIQTFIGQLKRDENERRRKAKELADNFIEEEEKERAKKKKIVCGATTKPKLKGKKKKKTRQVHTARTGNRDVTNDAEPEKHAEDLDVSNDSSDSSSSDSGHQEDKEEEDQDEVANWTTVRKHRPIPTHNRFNTPPAAGSAHMGE